MLVRASEEFIWHFIGYLHLSDALGRAPIHFDSFSYNAAQHGPGSIITGPPPRATDNYNDQFKSRPSPEIPEVKGPLSSGSVAPGLFSDGGFPSLPTTVDGFIGAFLDHGAIPAGGGGVPLGPLPDVGSLLLPLHYRFFDKLSDTIKINQSNDASDNDRLLVTGNDPVGPTLDEIYLMLGELQEIAETAKQEAETIEVELLPTGTEGILGARYVNRELTDVVLPGDSGGDGNGAAPEPSELSHLVKQGTQEITAGGNEQSNLAAVYSMPSGSPVTGLAEIDQHNDLGDDDEITDAAVQDLGTLIQNVSPPDDETNNTNVEARQLTQEIETGGNGQVNVFDAYLRTSAIAIETGIDTEQNNAMEDGDKIDSPTVKNLGTATQTVTVAGGVGRIGRGYRRGRTRGPSAAG